MVTASRSFSSGAQHTVEVPVYFAVPPYGGYLVFDYFSYDGTTDDDNPMTLTVSKDTVVTAHYYFYLG